ncbi:hypothetical protein ASG31_13065 [Chryseobacterium sp. Leaf404]|uniref:hypothetical protein n=1 Tax=unclassified Chryseobacterium TaxID=2593645 RepID=UPI0007006949|nr:MULTISPECIES: hypothetical protein [unclassified Chryseobacterium]KQT16441.1 hypothetical protein ASG31_13065 [Chryseobacterium sp. Leaf404]
MNTEENNNNNFSNGSNSFWEKMVSFWHNNRDFGQPEPFWKKKADLVNGTVPTNQLPSYVDDIIESETFQNLPASGEKGKIYIVISDNTQYRWSGSAYIQINSAEFQMTTNTYQEVNNVKRFINSNNHGYDLPIQAFGINGAKGGYFFYSAGMGTAQVNYDGNYFNFKNLNDSTYEKVRASEFVKSNSDNSKILLGGGGDKSISDFASILSLDNYTKTYKSLPYLPNTNVENKWLFYKIKGGTGVGTARTYERFDEDNIIMQGVIREGSDLVIGDNGDNYTGLLRTVLYSAIDKTISFAFIHDDGCTIYINGIQVYRNDIYNNSASATFNIKAGYSTIDFIWDEGNGADGISQIIPTIGSQVERIFLPQFVDFDIDTFVSKLGDTMSGNLTVPDASLNNHATNFQQLKKYAPIEKKRTYFHNGGPYNSTVVTRIYLPNTTVSDLVVRLNSSYHSGNAIGMIELHLIYGCNDGATWGWTSQIIKAFGNTTNWLFIDQTVHFDVAKNRNYINVHKNEPAVNPVFIEVEIRNNSNDLTDDSVFFEEDFNTPIINEKNLSYLDSSFIKQGGANYYIGWDGFENYLFKNDINQGYLWHSGNFNPEDQLPNDSNWLTHPTINKRKIIGELAWRNYGNGHTIFDASHGLTPTNINVDNKDSQVPWGPTFPTLMGFNGLNTYGVRVDNARIADGIAGYNLSNFVRIDVPQTIISKKTFTDTMIVQGENVNSGKTKLFLKNNASSDQNWALSHGSDYFTEGGFFIGTYIDGVFNWKMSVNSNGTIASNGEGNSQLWNQAYNWGNHSEQGYATQEWTSNSYFSKQGGDVNGKMKIIPGIGVTSNAPSAGDGSGASFLISGDNGLWGTAIGHNSSTGEAWLQPQRFDGGNNVFGIDIAPLGGVVKANGNEIWHKGNFKPADYQPAGDYILFNTDISTFSDRMFHTSFSSYTPEGLFSASATPLKTTTPGGKNIILGYRDYGSGQYYPRIGFTSETKWSLGPIADDFTIGINNDGSEIFKLTHSSAFINNSEIWHAGNFNPESLVDAQKSIDLQFIGNPIDLSDFTEGKYQFNILVNASADIDLSNFKREDSIIVRNPQPFPLRIQINGSGNYIGLKEYSTTMFYMSNDGRIVMTMMGHTEIIN